MVDTVIIVVCGFLALALTALLIWWLKIGKSHFIAKRCPERLNENKTGVSDNGNGESNNERKGTS